MGRQLRDYDEGYIGSQTPAKLGWKILGVVLAVLFVLGVVGFGIRWINAGAAIVSPENVKSQWQFVYDQDAALKAIASQWCTAQKAEDASLTNDERLQRGSQRIAIEQNYDRNKAIYDGRLRDAFRAKWVRPPDMDIPDQAPNLQQTVAKLNCYP